RPALSQVEVKTANGRAARAGDFSETIGHSNTLSVRASLPTVAAHGTGDHLAEQCLRGRRRRRSAFIANAAAEGGVPRALPTQRPRRVHRPANLSTLAISLSPGLCQSQGRQHGSRPRSANAPKRLASGDPARQRLRELVEPTLHASSPFAP